MSDVDEAPEPGERERLPGTLTRDPANRLEAERGSEADQEARMRAALGLFGQQRQASHAEHTPSERRTQGGSHMQIGARRHRFVQDGEVPVSVVRGRREQQSADLAPAFQKQDETAFERNRAETAERRLAERDAQLRSVQTRLGHAELERDEAVAALKALREQVASDALRAPASPLQEIDGDESDAGIARRRTMGRRRTDQIASEPSDGLAEPEPIKWWL